MPGTTNPIARPSLRAVFVRKVPFPCCLSISPSPRSSCNASDIVGLDTPNLLRKNLADYRRILAGEIDVTTVQ